MLLDVDLILQGIVISSIFLMVRSLPRIVLVLTAFRFKISIYLGLTNKNSIISKNPVLLSRLPKFVIEQWKNPEASIHLINDEIKKLHDLGTSFIECFTSAILLLIGGYYLGMDHFTSIFVYILTLILIVATFTGLYFDNKYQHILNYKLLEIQVINKPAS